MEDLKKVASGIENVSFVGLFKKMSCMGEIIIKGLSLEKFYTPFYINNMKGQSTHCESDTSWLSLLYICMLMYNYVMLILQKYLGSFSAGSRI